MDQSTNKQNDESFVIGFNIHLLSFTLPNNYIKPKDDIRVSITTIPEQTKQHFHIKGKKIYNLNHIFSLNITKQTNRVIIVLRKKSFLDDDPIIASTIIYSYDFPVIVTDIGQIDHEKLITDVKKLNIYYPLSKQIHDQQIKRDEITNNDFKRIVIGQMKVQLSFTKPFLSNKKIKTSKHNHHKSKKEKRKNNCS